MLIAPLAFFLCRLPLVAVLPVGQPFCGCHWIKRLATFGKARTWPFFRVFLTSWIESGRPTTKESVLVREAGNRLKLCLCFESLAIFRVDARSSVLLSTNQSFCELRLLTGDNLGATHYLSDCRKHFIAQGGESPGPTSRARCQAA